MSLTNIVYTPVDTGTAKVSLNVENTKVQEFYLLDGERLFIFKPHPPSPSPFGEGAVL